MSYRRALGATLSTTVRLDPKKAAALTQPAPASTAALATAAAQALARAPVRSMIPPRKAEGLVPSSCANLTDYQLPPEQIPVGQPLVVLFPFVLERPDDMPKVLAQILGVAGGGGPALQARLAAGARYQFVAGGWMRDTESQQSTTKGMLWLALAPAAPVASRENTATRGQLIQDAKALVKDALVRAGLRGSLTRSESDIDLGAVFSALATGRSDEELLRAAMDAAGGAASFAAVGRYLVVGMQRGQEASTLKRAFRERADTLQRAVAILQGLDVFRAQVESAIASARAAGPEGAAAAAELLASLEQQARTGQQVIRAAASAAPAAAQEAGAARQETLEAIRSAMLSAAEADVRAAPFALARERQRCLFLTKAQERVGATLSAVDAELDRSVEAAGWLLTHAAAIDGGIAVLAELEAKLAKARSDLGLTGFSKKVLGVPVWGWSVGGVLVFLGLMLALGRARKKRRAAGAPPARSAA